MSNNDYDHPTPAQPSDTRFPTPIDTFVEAAGDDLGGILRSRTFWMIYGFLQGVAVWGSLFLAGSGNSTTPTVVTILLATALFPTLPAQYVGIAWSVLAVGGAATVLQILQKYMLTPSTSSL